MTKITQTWKKKYLTMLSGQGISLITSGILQMSIIYYLTAKTNSAMVLSIATLIGFLPQAIFGPFAGAFVDRHSRKMVMIGADLLVAATGALLLLGTVFSELPIWLIMIVLCMRSIGTAFHSLASSAVTPLIVPQEQLTKCAGYNQTIQAVGSILSPAAAAVLYSIFPMNTIVLLDVAGAMIACSIVAVTPIPDPPACVEEMNPHIMQDIKDGYGMLKANKALLALFWIGAAYMFFFMPTSALYPLMSMGYFHGTPVHASISEIAFAVGMLAGSVLLSVWGGFKNRILSIGFSVFLMGISITLSGLLPNHAFPVFAACCIAMGFTAPFYGVQNALIQEQIAPEYLGRVFSLLGSIASLTMPLGLLCSGVFAEKIGVENWFLLCGIGILAVSVLVFVLPSLRKVDKVTGRKETTTTEDLITVINLMEASGILYWIDGGWGVDILAGKQTRTHRDIDINFDAQHTEKILDILFQHRYKIDTDQRPVRIELYSDKLGYLDIHPFVLNEDGTAKQADLEGGWYEFEKDYFGDADFEGITIPCISLKGQIIFHSGYELREKDKHDITVLKGLSE